jgi:flagellar capping protein FliD
VAQDISLDDLLRKQQEMSRLALEAQSAGSSARMQEIVAQLQALGSELEQLAAQLQAQSTAGTAARSGSTEVLLTPEQRSRVREATGIDLESIRIPDPTGISVHSMPLATPAQIEQRALQEAQRRQAAAAGEAAAQQQVAATLEIIDSQGTPALRQQLAELRQDPKFLGGLLQKK